MDKLKALEPFADERGNEIDFAGEPVTSAVTVVFEGSNNRLIVAPTAKIVELTVQFLGDGSVVEILPTSQNRVGLKLSMRLGHDSAIRIGENVGTQGRTLITAVEGADVTIGDDCMFAMGVEIRSDDAHPIYDVRTGERLNLAAPIAIGNHVWLAKFAAVLGGVRIGDGAVVGYRSIVTRDVPNNAIAVGAPAKIVRRDIAWERTRLIRLPSSGSKRRDEGKRSGYWALTSDEDPQWPPRVTRPVARPHGELLPQQNTPAASPPAQPPQPSGIGPRARRRAGKLLRRIGWR